MQQLIRNKDKKINWTDEAQVSFENSKRELCEAPVLGMPTEKGMFALDTDASVVLSDTEVKYGEVLPSSCVWIIVLLPG